MWIKNKIFKGVKCYGYKLLRFLYTKNTIFFYMCNEIDDKSDIDIPKDYRVVVVDSVDDLLDFKNSEYYNTIVKELVKGVVAYIIVDRNKVCHYSFVARNVAHIGEINKTFNNNGYYIYNCHTDGRCRGKGFYSYILSYIRSNHALSDSRYYIASLDWNVNSISVIERSGFSYLGKCKYISVLTFSTFLNFTGLNLN